MLCELYPNNTNWCKSTSWVSKTVASAYLAKGALHPTQKVIITGSDAVSAVDVIDFKSQLLNLLKVVVQRENLGKDWVQVALDHFRPVQLRDKHTESAFETSRAFEYI